MKRYVFRVVIEEGSDEFWEDINNNQKSGCEEVTELVMQALGQYHLDDDVTLVEYTDKE